MHFKTSSLEFLVTSSDLNRRVQPSFPRLMTKLGLDRTAMNWINKVGKSWTKSDWLNKLGNLCEIRLNHVHTETGFLNKLTR